MSMHDEEPGPVVQRLILGERLRALREASRVGLDDANVHLRWYRGKLSKVENGMLGLTERELATLLDLYRATGPEAAEVTQLGLESRRRAAPERVSDWSKQYVSLERAASEIRMVYAEIPGLLQTREFARTYLARSPVVTAADLDSMAAAREERGNRLLRDHAPQVWAVLGEEALLRRAGTADAVKAQFQRLSAIAALPTVSVRVVPLDHGPEAALTSPFTLLWIEGAKATIAYVETLTGADYVKTTAAYSVAFEQAQNAALSEEDTLKLIDRHVAELDA